jgi:hypothetical protein
MEMIRVGKRAVEIEKKRRAVRHHAPKNAARN